MSTRSTIGMVLPDGSVRAIYCHFDGYPDHHLPILTKHYATAERVAALLDLGDLSSLGEEIGTAHDFNRCPKGACNAYGRDRGETGTEADMFPSIAAFEQAGLQEYAYLFNGNWTFKSDDGGWLPAVVEATTADEPTNDAPAVEGRGVTYRNLPPDLQRVWAATYGAVAAARFDLYNTDRRDEAEEEAWASVRCANGGQDYDPAPESEPGGDEFNLAHQQLRNSVIEAARAYAHEEPLQGTRGTELHIAIRALHAFEREHGRRS